ncbi:helix-turn-helix transcriptional regulator [Sedimentibacter sp. zth1]|uniref:helix-turn-helix domain-containing protein n=1 Tax=Sedimentibacter sp. zth1 TaxID=2816908 RepID=UPI001A9142BB|nr:helix-turn-helix transcriptional regulator [Sedimentibacter sp. zth1]QSX05443.1 helix-turn-helix transcriptional regulator [Sedimentibacter sp. zth1]
MYESNFIANRIKAIAKKKNMQIKLLLDKCNLSKNTLSSMQSGGSTPKSENLAKIADYLDCSVDYLLGRTDNPEVNIQPVEHDTDEIIERFENLSDKSQDSFIKYMNLLLIQQKEENNKNIDNEAK